MTNIINRNFSYFLTCLLGIYTGISSTIALAEADEYQRVIVAEPFIEFHSGPGRGYPVFHVIEKGEKIKLIKKKTQWYKVKSDKGIEGWVHEDKLLETFTLGGDKYDIKSADKEDYIRRNFEAGVLAGEFGGANVMTLFAGWNWTPNISTELAFSQAIGSASDIQFVNLNMTHQAFPDWIVSPYVKLGVGVIQTKPNTTLVLTEDREDEMLHAGVGIRVYISEQFLFRAEYNSHTILTSRNDNDEVEEWKLGFSVFF